MQRRRLAGWQMKLDRDIHALFGCERLIALDVSRFGLFVTAKNTKFLLDSYNCSPHRPDLFLARSGW